MDKSTNDENDHPSMELVSTRVLDAPRDVVFNAFSDANYLARWWGPKGFSNTINVFDFRPGGAWRFVMHGPNGADYPNESEFIEIVKPERIVLRHMRPMHEFLMTMTFVENDGKTTLTWRMRFESATELDAVRHYIPEANEQNFDRLAELLRQISR